VQHNTLLFLKIIIIGAIIGGRAKRRERNHRDHHHFVGMRYIFFAVLDDLTQATRTTFVVRPCFVLVISLV